MSYSKYFNNRARMCSLAARNGQGNLKKDKKKFIYLISPNNITKNFFKNLQLVFDSKIYFFK